MDVLALIFLPFQNTLELFNRAALHPDGQHAVVVVADHARPKLVHQKDDDRLVIDAMG